MAVLPFHPAEPVTEPAPRADAQQWAEARDALLLADTLAQLVYGCRTAELSPSEAAHVRRVGVHALRAVHSSWPRAAHEHARNACDELLARELQPTIRMLTAAVLSAYHDIMEGTLVLPPDLYQQITKDENR